jgi:hypothetical protein
MHGTLRVPDVTCTDKQGRSMLLAPGYFGTLRKLERFHGVHRRGSGSRSRRDREAAELGRGVATVATPRGVCPRGGGIRPVQFGKLRERRMHSDQ